MNVQKKDGKNFMLPFLAIDLYLRHAESSWIKLSGHIKFKE